MTQLSEPAVERRFGQLVLLHQRRSPKPGTTNFAYGLAWRKVTGGATNDFTYSGQGFPTEQIQYPATLQNPGDPDPSVVTYFYYNARGQLYESQVQGGATTQMTYDAMGRTTSRMVYDQNGNLVSTEFWYYNQNGELEWYQSPRSNPQEYVWYIHDGAGRLTQQINWRSQGMLNELEWKRRTDIMFMQPISIPMTGFGKFS